MFAPAAAGDVSDEVRRLSLSARAGVLHDMPAQVAGRLRGLIGDLVVAPMVGRMPWAAGQLRVL